ncbi:acyl-CoA dehydrogenase family protein [bacterium]|nr:acyl-CoA dehydrogenase family protein [bacterium]
MAQTFIDEKTRNKEEVEALEVAEAARETQWEHPSFVGDIFLGKLRTSSILPYAFQTDEDRKIGDAYLEKLDKFLAANLDGDQVDREGQIPDTVMKGLAELGAFGMKIPKEYGGLGLSQVNYNRALALTNGYCSSTTALLSAHQSIGVPQPLLMFGTPEQKKKYLPQFAKGAISAFALTEPEVGSDPARLATTAVPTPDGNHYIINGTKLWCTNGVIADILVVMAQTPSITVNGKERKQITAFIVESNTPGFEVLHRCRFMGLNGVQNGLLKFTNVKVPKENIIWGLGKGLKLALTTLNAGRLSIPACCIGFTRKVIEECRLWGNERKQWGNAIGKHEPGAQKLAQMTGNLLAMESITWLAGVWVDRGTQDIRLEAAMAKLFCSLRSHEIVEQGLQMRGGRGYETYASLKARGERPFPAERSVRDSRINQIVEGTNEIMRLFIAREALDKHLEVAGDVLNPRLPITRRLTALVKAGMFYAWWYPLQWLSISPWPMHSGMGRLGKHLRYAKRTAHRLARTTFHLMVWHGPKLERKQVQLGRVVDIATELFAISATIGRAHGSKEANVRDAADIFCLDARHRIEENFRAIRCNHDSRTYKLGLKVLDGSLLWQEAAR